MPNTYVRDLPPLPTMEPIHPAFADGGGDRHRTPPTSSLTVDSARRVMDEQVRAFEADPVRSVYGRTIPGPDDGVPIRVYDDRPADSGAGPVLVWLHKGGFVHGSLETEDPVCRALATAGDLVVVSVEYRLAPEHPFPAAFNDAVATLEWVADNAGALGGDPALLAIGGHSAGGTLAAAVARHDRDFERHALAAQLLVYAGLNPYPFPFAEAFDSYDEPERQHRLTLEGMAWSRGHYLADPVHARNPYAYPLQASDHAGLPPAVVVTAGYDPMCDDGDAYAERLRAAGTAVTTAHYASMPHGFFAALDVPEAREALARTVQDLLESITSR